MNLTATAGVTMRSTRLPSLSPAIRRPISLKSGESGDWIPFCLHLEVEGMERGIKNALEFLKMRWNPKRYLKY
jgi:hypothetical protein